MLVTREGDYAVRCVLEVARSGRTSAAEVASRQGISSPFLGKIVQELAKAGILATRRGVGGGIALARPSDTITLLEIVQAVEGPLRVNTCLATPPECDRVDECPAYPIWCRVQLALNGLLSVSVREVLEQTPIEPAEFLERTSEASAGKKRGRR